MLRGVTSREKQPKIRRMLVPYMKELKKYDILADRSEAEIAALLAGATVKELKHREILYRAGDHAFNFALVVQGALKLVKYTPSGDEFIVHFATPGDPVGALVMSSPGGAYPVTVVAMGSVVVLKIPKSTFLASWMNDPRAMQNVNRMLFHRMNDMHEQRVMTKAPLVQKIARQLALLIERVDGEGATALSIPLTRQELADSVGASVESVIRVMSEWSGKGMIRTADHHIEVLRMDMLIAIFQRPGANANSPGLYDGRHTQE
ncbi:MAG TPA: Crp/Fnr family transcriptional regulator [Bdellovibrionales bacterium]|nr:Crp/Fnr family transcriptional regulator [Bdellovibrionales bacterium]